MSMSDQFNEMIEVKFKIDDDWLARVVAWSYFDVVAGLDQKIFVQPLLSIRRLCARRFNILNQSISESCVNGRA